ncbi:hypothetical protein PVAG01_06171 [Phlyctema vagabunda]|uniref:Uncharacterized protein n=1 Tax=Phlyctema vagabunda TaxID=108571 RepID=A0ABR4PFH6_9HELO
MQIEPRHSIYVDSEITGSFIVDAELSNIHGTPHSNISVSSNSSELDFTIMVESSSEILVQDKININTTNNLFEFDLSQLEARFEAYTIILRAGTGYRNRSYTATTKLFYLPDKTLGSVTKIDNLYGGMLFKNNVTNNEFIPLLAYGFYTNYGGYLDLSLENVQLYVDMGFNAIHPIPSFSPNLTRIFDYADEVNLLWQYDMRGTYQNLTSVAEQVMLVKDYTSLFAYYTADEPDGWQDPLNSTKLAYGTITALDKYHPVGIALNCQDFYFDEYTRGADYIMEDAYPVGINATYSIPWNTPCNETYGDCGCDNCLGKLQDVPDRLNDYTEYQELLGQWRKPLWAVPQSFSEPGNYWARDPSADEAWVMNALSFNHNAKSIMIWTYPTSNELADAHAKMAKVVTVSPVLDFLIGANPIPITVDSVPHLDVAYWICGSQIMIIVANPEYTAVEMVSIMLPLNPSHITSQPWGSVDWSLKDGYLEAGTLLALSTSIILVDL